MGKPSSGARNAIEGRTDRYNARWTHLLGSDDGLIAHFSVVGTFVIESPGGF